MGEEVYGQQLPDEEGKGASEDKRREERGEGGESEHNHCQTKTSVGRDRRGKG